MAELKSKPQLVLIPGAWHKPICFSIIIPKLEAAGYTVHTTQMPSVTDKDPPEDLTADIAALRQLVDKAIGPGEDVVVISHSWAGTVASSALVGYSKDSREKTGKKGGVVRCGCMGLPRYTNFARADFIPYRPDMTSFMIPEGVGLMDAFEGLPPSWWTLEDDVFATLTDDAPYTLYNDLPPAERANWVAQASRTHSYHTFKTKVTGESWLEIPTSYLMCEDDQTVPLVAQEGMTAMVKDKGGDIQIERLKSGHSPFLSHPDETVQWIRRVAGEEV